MSESEGVFLCFIHCFMSSKIARLLNTQPEVRNFLIGPLNLDLSKLPGNIIARVITCEKGVLDGWENPTSTSGNFRDNKYATDIDRMKLRNRIVEELYKMRVLPDDDKVVLGKGGAMPENPQKKKHAFILIGLPASGKSCVAARISKDYGAVILDSDLAKRKLPEYAQYPWGASLVNTESSMIIFGDENNTSFSSLYEKVVKEGINVVVSKVASDPDDIIRVCKGLKEANYKVHLTLVYLSREKSTIRALYRFIKTDRYVPLTMIFDEYSNEAALTYFKLKNARPDYIDTYGIINTDVPLEAPFVCTDILGSNPAKMFKKVKNSLI